MVWSYVGFVDETLQRITNLVIFTSTAKQVRNRDFSEGELSLDTSIRGLTMHGIAGGCFSGSKVRAFVNAGAKARQ
jgi:hypothetical protein